MNCFIPASSAWLGSAVLTQLMGHVTPRRLLRQLSKQKRSQCLIFASPVSLSVSCRHVLLREAAIVIGVIGAETGMGGGAGQVPAAVT